MFGQLAAVAAFGVAVLGTGFVHAYIPPTTAVDRGEIFVPDPAIAGLMAVGFDAVVADYYWLQAIQAVGGDQPITAELGVHLGKLIDVVTTLDPWVDHPYRFAGIWLTESEENIRTANRLLERGIARHPDEWRNRFYLGFNLFYYLLDNDAAAEQLEMASELPGSPPYLPRLVARLRSESADIDVAETFLRELVRNARDEVIRQGYLAGLDEIEIEKKARFLDRSRKAFGELNGRDIRSVDELISGPHPLLRALPNPEPEALPVQLGRGSVWKLDSDTDEIVSSYYDRRYRVHFAKWDREKAEQWASQRAGGTTSSSAAGQPEDAEDPSGAR